jgi:HTH-type transcriptional regulator/antitoxin HigA
MEEMGLSTINPTKYGRLCADVIPKVIKSKEEFDRLVAKMEELDFKPNPTLEEEALSELLMKLIKDYDDQHYPPSPMAPHKLIQYLMDQRDLKQADLLPVFGSRSVASDVINGKREPSKAHISKLAKFFHVAPALFLE